VTTEPNQPTTTTSKPRGHRLSSDGKWRSFPKTPHLLQYVSSGTFYGRTKVHGKIIRQSLETDVFTTAKLRLVDFLKANQEARTSVRAIPFTEALDLYGRGLDQNTPLKPQSKQYRRWCIRRIQLSWPGLWKKRIDEITKEECRAWAARLNQEIACHYYNNTIGTLRQILDCAIADFTERTKTRLDNPMEGIPRARITQKELKLPEPDRFRPLVEEIRDNSGGWGPRVADLVEFLAYSGMRNPSESQWVAWEDVDWQHREIIVRGNPNTGTKNSEIRRIPILPDMAQLLERLREGQDKTGPIFKVTRCGASLTRACKKLGIDRITPHDLRHLFATRCIEADVPIPTVAHWMGHKDGGALMMKVYGHLRNQHSQEMAAKVTF
jgi:integrase